MTVETFHFGPCYIDKKILRKALRQNDNEFYL